MKHVTLALTLVLAVSANTALSQQFPTISDKPTPQFLIENFGDSLGASEAAAARPIPGTALDLIKAFEGWFPSAYNDPIGLCTIGYGHLISRKTCSETDLGEFAGTLTLQEGEALLEEDTVGARLAVQRLVVPELTDAQFGALVSFTFNLGAGNLERSTLLQLINEEAYSAASKQFGRWILADGKVLNGLVSRRACEAALFRGDLSLSEEFDRRSCDSLGIASDPGQLIDVNVGE